MKRKRKAAKEAATEPITNPLHGRFDEMVDAVLGPGDETRPARSRPKVSVKAGRRPGEVRCEKCGNLWVLRKRENKIELCPKCAQ